MLRSTFLIEGFVYVSHTKSILSLPVLKMFLVLVPVNGEKHCIHHIGLCIVGKWIAACYFLLQFMHEFGFICFVQGAIDMC